MEPENKLLTNVKNGIGRLQLQYGLQVPLRSRPQNGWKQPEDVLGLLRFSLQVIEDQTLRPTVFGRLLSAAPKNNNRSMCDLNVSIEVVNDMPNRPFEITITGYDLDRHTSQTIVAVPNDLGLSDLMIYKPGNLVIWSKQSPMLYCILEQNGPFQYLVGRIKGYICRQCTFKANFPETLLLQPNEIRYATPMECENAFYDARKDERYGRFDLDWEISKQDKPVVIFPEKK